MIKLPAVAKLSIPKTIAAKIDARQALRADRLSVDTLSKQIGTQEAQMEAAIFEQLDEVGSSSGASKLASVSISESTQFSFSDFDAFCAYVGKKKYWHLFQRRVSVESCREAFALLKPNENMGLTPKVIRKLNFSKKG
jgi:hypothetical protein